MLIGIDGNEANVKNRVGSGQYAFELLKQFTRDKKHQFSIYLKDKPVADLPKETENFMKKILGIFIFRGKYLLNVKDIEGRFIDEKDFYIEAETMTHGTPCNAYVFVKKGQKIDLA